MDKLKKCALEFKKLFGKDYYYIFENDMKIRVYFAKKHFHHLLGLGKLTDIAPLVITKNNTATNIYKNIEKGKITYSQISKSVFFDKIKDRIDNFNYLNNMLFEKVVINFDKSKVPSSKLQSDIILYQDKGNYYLHLCLAQDNICYYPETFIVQHDNYYIKGQQELKIKELTVIEKGKILISKQYITPDKETQDQVAITST